MIIASAFGRSSPEEDKNELTKHPMPVADYKTYCKMLDRARAGRFAFPAVNVTSLTTANAVLRGLAESESDGIIQVSTGGEVGAKKVYDPRSYLALAEVAMAERVKQSASDLRSTGKTMFGS